MHSPRPYGLLVLDGKLSDRDQLFIDQELKKLTNQKTLSNLDSIRQVKNLPDGGYVILQDMGGILKAIAHKELSFDEFELDGFAKTYVPMLYSGVITKAIVRTEDKKVGIKLTEQARRRLAGYADAQSEFPAKDVALERFFIEYHPKFYYFKPDYTGIYTHTQYVKQRPTWYSGAMAEVMQIVGGYGKQAVNNLPDTPIERASFKITDKYIERISSELDGVRLPGYSGLPNIDGQFQYDYKFGKTHLVSFDSENKPWLIQIDPSGVWAMPLPLIPATTTEAFREYIEEVSDDEILKILDRFGGMPSGESFPTGQDFQSWRRAGVVIKVCDTADFYNYSAMYMACGWSFNSKGHEGFNTCWGYADNGLMYAYGYKIKLNLVPAQKEGWLGKIDVDSNYVEVISQYLNKLAALLPKGEQKTLAIMYKLRRVPQEDIYQQALTTLYNPLGVTSVDVDYWDNYEVKPIASHSGSVTRVSSGAVCWLLGKQYPTSMGRLKFPELTGQGCESFIFASPDYKGEFVRCDTVMFGCYVDDQLKVVKFFIDDRTFHKKVQSTFEDVMIVGQWEKTETTGSTGLMGYFYTSDFDDRRLASPSKTHTSIVGTDLGYGNPLYKTPGVLMMNGLLSRARYYKHVTVTDSISGDGMDCAICVPNFNRDCILYAFQESTQSKSKKEKHTLHSMADPTSYMMWTYDFIFHWIGVAGKGEPQPTTGDYVYISGPPNYNPSEYSDFADSGDWFGVGNGYVDVSAICSPYTDRVSGVHHAGGVAIGGEGPTIEPFDKSEHESNIQKGRVSIAYGNAGTPVIHRNLPEPWYFSFSPADVGGTPFYFYRDACKVVFGDSEYANISETDQYNRRCKWGYTSLVEHKAAYHFIGVINE
ncbi:hypothetical protein [Acinetobacter sp. CIP 102129]|uniref:hypothetical protein n=1 Tax=Acinetobacter sp. CIP 102129 TaxID=1144664 RepID=UPI0002CFB9CF|nr:hypothetical protein [Acinetobacter sp. CIP 102129]ENU86121.1 hypothetical protein F973_01718 [Acinetobacter sp. CIP 102129]